MCYSPLFFVLVGCEGGRSPFGPESNIQTEIDSQDYERVVKPLFFRFEQWTHFPDTFLFICDEKKGVAGVLEFDFGDGTVARVGDYSVNHTYSVPGSYVVTLKYGDRRSELLLVVSESAGIGISYDLRSPKDALFRVSGGGVPGPYTIDFGDGAFGFVDPHGSVRHTYPDGEKGKVTTYTVVLYAHERTQVLAETYVNIH